MKRFYIVRHGAAQSAFEAGSDVARQLTRSGEEEVRRVAEWLAARPDTVSPERIVASAAPRARQTAEILAEEFGGVALSTVGELYAGGANDYLDAAVRSLPDEVDCAMVVGHNPAVSELLAALTGAMAGEYLMRKGDMACVAFGEVPDGASWEELYATTGHIERYVVAASVCDS
ncbi:MAG: phosphohistidine phosphatase SixA [Rikenella sp.]|nr:phosphohistidine phosphatase SixA [Rikenella sp.]